MLLKDKVVIITCASKGLGVSMAEVCAAQGARVVLAARSEALLKKVQKQIESAGGKALAVACDVGKLADLDKLVAATVKAFGRIDGLINNAGVNFVKPFLQTSEEDWDHIMDVDLKGSFFLAQKCAQQMAKQVTIRSVLEVSNG